MRWPRRLSEFRPAVGGPCVGTPLLRSCRQVYSEAALMPLQLNTLACSSMVTLSQAVRKLKKHQREQIKTVRIEVDSQSVMASVLNNMRNTGSPPRKYLPALKHIDIFLCQEFPNLLEDYYRSRCGLFPEASGLSFTLQYLDTPWPEQLYYSW
jgi:hypothetical protein